MKQMKPELSNSLMVVIIEWYTDTVKDHNEYLETLKLRQLKLKHLKCTPSAYH